MKVKLFSGHDCKELERAINEYLESVSNIDVVDIKYSCSDNYNDAMVITR